MRQLTVQLATISVFLGAGAILSADTISLRSGDSVQGTFLGGTARQIRVDVNGEIRTFDVGQIQSVVFTDSRAQAPAPQPQPQPAPYPARRNDEAPSQPLPDSASSAGVILPADTPITVRMIDSVNSQTARLGQIFKASIDEPVVLDGQQVIPRGADVLTKLVDDRQSGKLQGRTILTLALVSINVNGRIVEVTSADVQTASGSRGSRTAKVVGGGAALGAIIGAIAGGGKGAAIGAGSGAAVGGGAEVLTNGQEVKIPSETRLTFRLQTPARI